MQNQRRQLPLLRPENGCIYAGKSHISRRKPTKSLIGSDSLMSSLWFLFYTLCEKNRRRNSSSPTQYLYYYLIPGFLTSQGIGEIVQVLYRLGIKLYEDVSGAQTGLSRRRAVTDISDPASIRAKAHRLDVFRRKVCKTEMPETP